MLTLEDPIALAMRHTGVRRTGSAKRTGVGVEVRGASGGVEVAG